MPRTSVMGAAKYGSGLVIFTDYVIYRNPQSGTWEDISIVEARKSGLIDRRQFDEPGRVATIKDIVDYLNTQDRR